jgi:hypothetical protein
MIGHACAALRAGLRNALDAADADGLPPEMQLMLMVSELGELTARLAGAGFEMQLSDLLEAVEHASRAALSDDDYQAGEHFAAGGWLN